MIRAVEVVRKRCSDVVADDKRYAAVALYVFLYRFIPFRFRGFNHRIDFGVVEPAAVHIVPPKSRALYHHVCKVALQRFDRFL